MANTEVNERNFWRTVHALADKCVMKNRGPYQQICISDEGGDATQVVAIDGFSAFRFRFPQDRHWLGINITTEEGFGDDRDVVLDAEDIATPEIKKLLKDPNFSVSAQRPLVEGTWDEDYSEEAELGFSGSDRSSASQTVWVPTHIGSTYPVNIAEMLDRTNGSNEPLGMFATADALGALSQQKGKPPVLLFAKEKKLWFGFLDKQHKPDNVVPVGEAPAEAGKSKRCVVFGKQHIKAALDVLATQCDTVEVSVNKETRNPAYFCSDADVKAEAAVAPLGLEDGASLARTACVDFLKENK